MPQRQVEVRLLFGESLKIGAIGRAWQCTAPRRNLCSKGTAQEAVSSPLSFPRPNCAIGGRSGTTRRGKEHDCCRRENLRVLVNSTKKGVSQLHKGNTESTSKQEYTEMSRETTELQVYEIHNI
jgi:hypothetical protein